MLWGAIAILECFDLDDSTNQIRVAKSGTSMLVSYRNVGKYSVVLSRPAAKVQGANICKLQYASCAMWVSSFAVHSEGAPYILSLQYPCVSHQKTVAHSEAHRSNSLGPAIKGLGLTGPCVNPIVV